MTKEVSYNEYTKELLDNLCQGAFLTTSYQGKTNTMTIGWGSIGFSWGKPVFTVMVRHSRYTHELLDKSQEFTVSIPYGGMKNALALCGSKSGRNMDKVTAAELTIEPGIKLSTPIIKGCQLHYECKVVAKQDLPESGLSSAVDTKWYKEGDYHTLYFGEIVACYIEK